MDVFSNAKPKNRIHGSEMNKSLLGLCDTNNNHDKTEPSYLQNMIRLEF